jgi:predicted nucleotidyltransferase/biotin operon repressor
LLARVYLQADNKVPLAQLAHELDLDRAGVKREADRLEAAGLVASDRVGRQRLLRPNPRSPYYDHLYGLLLTAFGPATVIAPRLRAVRGIEHAYLFGSWASRYAGEQGNDPADIDVMLVGSPERNEIYRIARELSQTLGREVNPIIVSPERWAEASDGFLRDVKESPLVELDLAHDRE